MSAERFDTAVIGSGPGGYVAAIRAAQLGHRVAVVEEDRLGGVCLNWGCIPSKALLTGAELAESLRHSGPNFGITCDGLRFDYGAVVDHSRRCADRLCRGVQSLLKKNKISTVAGRGRLAGAGVIQVEGEGPESIEADQVILATGSGEWVPEGIEVDGERVLTSREALASKRIPERIAIVGAGAVGLEFAYVYAMYGAQVTVVEMAEQILPGADAEVARVLARSFQRRQIDLRTRCRFQGLAVQPRGGGVEVAIDREGVEEVLAVDQVLLAIGRKPLSGDLGLETAGVEIDARGFVVVDEALRTTAPQIWAIGDLIGPPLLAHKASEEGVAVAERLSGTATPALDHRRIPSCIYCQPQVAWIGLREDEARERYGEDLRVGRFPFTASGKAVAAAHTEGFAKLLAEPRYGEIVGAHLVGYGATELIAEIGLAMTLEATTAEIASTCHAHPTLSEALLETALAAEGRSINF